MLRLDLALLALIPATTKVLWPSWHLLGELGLALRARSELRLLLSEPLLQRVQEVVVLRAFTEVRVE